ncbi:MAG: homoserine O-acetyltransferase [Muribaculaceae bacterium]|nr:homoserine O-acetyltransferase [Muribaculaceae bacterium]
MKPKIFHSPVPFTLESGDTLPYLEIAYHTYGHLNSDSSNVIWVMHALTANSEVADWWPHTVEEGKFLDPSKYFIVCANVIGSCYGSTGPLSINPLTGKPWYNDFPLITIRDMVGAHILLAEHLGITKIECVIGSSLGGYQAIELLCSFPGFANKAVLIATGSYTHPWQAAFNETMRMILEADQTYGTPTPDAGTKGLAAARALGLLSYRGRTAYDITQKDNITLNNIPFNRKVHSYQRYQGDKLTRRFNAYSYHRICSAVDSHDIARGRGTRDQVLKSIKCPCLIIAISSDLIYPPCDHEDMAKFIPNAKFTVIDSPFAHDGFLVEHEKLDHLIKDFLTI